MRRNRRRRRRRRRRERAVVDENTILIESLDRINSIDYDKLIL